MHPGDVVYNVKYDRYLGSKRRSSEKTINEQMLLMWTLFLIQVFTDLVKQLKAVNIVVAIL